MMGSTISVKIWDILTELVGSKNLKGLDNTREKKLFSDQLKIPKLFCIFRFSAASSLISSVSEAGDCRLVVVRF